MVPVFKLGRMAERSLRQPLDTARPGLARPSAAGQVEEEGRQRWYSLEESTSAPQLKSRRSADAQRPVGQRAVRAAIANF